MKNRGFSLIEVLAAVAIIGIITFLALPNIVAVKQDTEINLAIARAEAANMAVASYVQANGHATAAGTWGTGSAPADNVARYALIAPYLAFAPASVNDYVPNGYTLTLPTNLASLSKATLKDPLANTIDY